MFFSLPNSPKVILPVGNPNPATIRGNTDDDWRFPCFPPTRNRFNWVRSPVDRF